MEFRLLLDTFEGDFWLPGRDLLGFTSIGAVDLDLDFTRGFMPLTPPLLILFSLAPTTMNPRLPPIDPFGAVAAIPLSSNSFSAFFCKYCAIIRSRLACASCFICCFCCISFIRRSWPSIFATSVAFFRLSKSFSFFSICRRRNSCSRSFLFASSAPSFRIGEPSPISLPNASTSMTKARAPFFSATGSFGSFNPASEKNLLLTLLCFLLQWKFA